MVFCTAELKGAIAPFSSGNSAVVVGRTGTSHCRVHNVKSMETSGVPPASLRGLGSACLVSNRIVPVSLQVIARDFFLRFLKRRGGKGVHFVTGKPTTPPNTHAPPIVPSCRYLLERASDVWGAQSSRVLTSAACASTHSTHSLTPRFLRFLLQARARTSRTSSCPSPPTSRYRGARRSHRPCWRGCWRQTTWRVASRTATSSSWAAGPSRAKSASRSLRRALLMPQANTGSIYRCGERT